MIAEDQYLLLWKGRQTGPFSADRIREKLYAGDINRMHQIHVDGRWQILDEYLEKLRETELEARRTEQQRTRESVTKRQFEAHPHEEHAKREDDPTPLSHLIPREAPPPPPAFHPSSTFSSALPLIDAEGSYGLDPHAPPFSSSQARTSGLAITALVMGLCNFIPFVNFFSWILALVFGHVALSQIKADQSLTGRGMAIAGLAITYFLLIVGITLITLSLAYNKPLPYHF